jgi:hypothetical protein
MDMGWLRILQSWYVSTALCPLVFLSLALNDLIFILFYVFGKIRMGYLWGFNPSWLRGDIAAREKPISYAWGRPRWIVHCTYWWRFVLQPALFSSSSYYLITVPDVSNVFQPVFKNSTGWKKSDLPDSDSFTKFWVNSTDFFLIWTPPNPPNFDEF